MISSHAAHAGLEERSRLHFTLSHFNRSQWALKMTNMSYIPMVSTVLDWFMYSSLWFFLRKCSLFFANFLMSQLEDFYSEGFGTKLGMDLRKSEGVFSFRAYSEWKIANAIAFFDILNFRFGVSEILRPHSNGDFGFAIAFSMWTSQE